MFVVGHNQQPRALKMDGTGREENIRSIPGVPYKNHRSISMVRTPDGKSLFVSHGRTIIRVDAATMVARETYTAELPCRVFHAWQGPPTTNAHPRFGVPKPCILLYVIGARYIGYGKTRARDFKTHLYKIGIRE